MDHHMKIPQKVSGRVVSKKPISLSRAAKLISRFAAVENGSSPAVSLYLQRSADAFNHLVQFHDKRSKPDSKRAQAEEDSEKLARESEKEAVNGGDAVETPAKKKKKRKSESESGKANLDTTEKDSEKLVSGRGTDIINGGDAAKSPKKKSGDASLDSKSFKDSENLTRENKTEIAGTPSKKKKKKSGESGSKK